MKTVSLLYVTLFCIGVMSCREQDVEEPKILRAMFKGDSITEARIDQTNGIITVTQSGFNARLRNKLAFMSLDITPTSVLSAAKLETFERLHPLYGDTPLGIYLDFVQYDNREPYEIFARRKTDRQQKPYKILLQAAGPVEFVTIPGNSDIQTIDLKHYVTHHVSMPVRNLYDGNPDGFRIFATAEGSSTPVELEIDRYSIKSRDMVTFYFNQAATKPGLYTIELRKTDGQRAIAPTRIRVEK